MSAQAKWMLFVALLVVAIGGGRVAWPRTPDRPAALACLGEGFVLFLSACRLEKGDVGHRL
jgi:hypothetical protein